MDNDPGEWHDLVNDEPDVAQALKDKFDAWEATLPVNKLSDKPTNRNNDFNNGKRINVIDFNQKITK